MAYKDSLRQEMEGRRREYMEISRRIEGLAMGPVRMTLKQRRNAIAADMVRLRQVLINEELKSEHPQDVPPLRLPTKVYTGTIR